MTNLDHDASDDTIKEDTIKEDTIKEDVSTANELSTPRDRTGWAVISCQITAVHRGALNTQYHLLHTCLTNG